MVWLPKIAPWGWLKAKIRFLERLSPEELGAGLSKVIMMVVAKVLGGKVKVPGVKRKSTPRIAVPPLKS